MEDLSYVYILLALLLALIRNGCRLRTENIQPALFREYLPCITGSKVGHYNYEELIID